MTNPDFVALAQSMRVHAIRCDNIADLPAKMKEFMEYDNSKPIVLEARVVKVRSCVILAVLPRCGERGRAGSRGDARGEVAAGAPFLASSPSCCLACVPSASLEL